MMETRVCYKCYWRLPTEAFAMRKENNRPMPYCRICNKIAQREYNIAWRQQYHTHIHVIYLLPKENYIGATACINKRISSHKRTGKDTTGWLIMHQTNCLDTASNIEDRYHEHGYNGRGVMAYRDTVGYMHLELIEQIPDSETGLYW